MLFKLKLKYYIIVFIIFFSWANLAYANLEITEIMYSPEGGSDYEWIEVYNNGTTSVDLNKYRFFHGENSGPITLKIGESTILQSSKYAVIAKSQTDYNWLEFFDMVFSASVLSLPDSGDNTYIAISDSNKTIIDDVTYDISKGGSKASKSSLSKIDGEWVSGIPTPGKTNQSASSLSDNNETTADTIDTGDINTTTANSGSNTSSSSTSKEKQDILKITTKIISPKIVLAGIPFSFSSLTTTNRGEIYAVGRFVWNFGDGMVVEVKEDGPFKYVYEYPGEYLLSLSYFDSYFSKEPDATNKMVIKVIPSEVYISSVGDDTDPFIEIENKSNYDISLSDWVITAQSHYFIIPVGTTLLAGNKIKFSSRITGFISEDIKSVFIMNPNKEIVASYPIEIKKPIQKNPTIKNFINNNSDTYIKEKEDTLFKDSQIINLNDLAASASGSEFELPKSTYPFIGLIVIIGIGITSFLLIKRKEKIEDYEDKEIRPEDMTIIE